MVLRYCSVSVINILLQTKGAYVITRLAIPTFVDRFLAGDWSDVPPNYFTQLTGAAIFIFFGYFGARLQRWAFIAGAILYTLDAVLYALIGEWFALGFHLFILLNVVLGVRTIGDYEVIRKKVRA